MVPIQKDMFLGYPFAAGPNIRLLMIFPIKSYYIYTYIYIQISWLSHGHLWFCSQPWFVVADPRPPLSPLTAVLVATRTFGTAQRLWMGHDGTGIMIVINYCASFCSSFCSNQVNNGKYTYSKDLETQFIQHIHEEINQLTQQQSWKRG